MCVRCVAAGLRGRRGLGKENMLRSVCVAGEDMEKSVLELWQVCAAGEDKGEC